VLGAPQRLRSDGVAPLDFWGTPADEPVVLAWMPAVSIYSNDPDGNMLELLLYALRAAAAGIRRSHLE